MPSLPDIPDEFFAASREIGSDPMLVQGAGGNTSCKQNSVMWIKSSGAELSCAGIDDIFAAVDVPRALAELEGGGDGTCRTALMDRSRNLRPSIETTFHALLPHKFVFHYHSVRSLAHSITIEGRQSLHDKLSGLNWAAVPYARPGVPLSKEIRSSAAETGADIFVLQNHGIIVAGEDCAEIAGTISELERRLEMSKRPGVDLPARGESVQGWNPCRQAGPLAMDGITSERASAGSYYPDHVVFLGPALAMPSLERLASDPDAYGPAAVVPGVGAYLREGAVPAEKAMLICLSEVLSLVPDDWSLQAIGYEAEAELLGWDAEKHRRKLAGEA